MKKINIKINGDATLAFSKTIGLRVASPNFSNLVNININRPASTTQPMFLGKWRSTGLPNTTKACDFVANSWPIDQTVQIDEFDVTMNPDGKIQTNSFSVSSNMIADADILSDGTAYGASHPVFLRLTNFKQEGEDEVRGSFNVLSKFSNLSSIQMSVTATFNMTIRAWKNHWATITGEEDELLVDNDRGLGTPDADGIVWRELISAWATCDDKTADPISMELVSADGIPGLTLDDYDPYSFSGYLTARDRWDIGEETSVLKNVKIRVTYAFDDGDREVDFTVPIRRENSGNGDPRYIYFATYNNYTVYMFKGNMSVDKFNEYLNNSSSFPFLIMFGSEMGTDTGIVTHKLELPLEVNVVSGNSVSTANIDEQESDLTAIWTWNDNTVAGSGLQIRSLYIPASTIIEDATINLY